MYVDVVVVVWWVSQVGLVGEAVDSIRFDLIRLGTWPANNRLKISPSTREKQ